MGMGVKRVGYEEVMEGVRRVGDVVESKTDWGSGVFGRDRWVEGGVGGGRGGLSERWMGGKRGV